MNKDVVQILYISWNIFFSPYLQRNQQISRQSPISSIIKTECLYSPSYKNLHFGTSLAERFDCRVESKWLINATISIIINR